MSPSTPTTNSSARVADFFNNSGKNMNKKTKEELKELMYAFVALICSLALVIQCNSSFNGLTMADCKTTKKEKTSIKADTIKTKATTIRNNLYRTHQVKSK